jgi:hypothetical protein
MAEAQNYIFSHREIVETLIKKQNLHEGLWMIYIEFNLQGGNVGQSKDQALPSAIIQVGKIGIQRVDKDNPFADSALVVDAKAVNPA